MVELTILSGPERGKVIHVERLPARLGRAPAMDVRLSGPGVWDHHLDLSCNADGRISLRTAGEARAAMDDQAVTEASIRNGSRIDLGGLSLRFAIRAMPQRALRLRECSVWIVGAVLLVIEAVLVWWTGR